MTCGFTKGVNVDVSHFEINDFLGESALLSIFMVNPSPTTAKVRV